MRFFRENGSFDEARCVVRERVTIERKLLTPVLVRPFIWVYSILFDYGLSPVRAVGVFAACLVVGAQGVALADLGPAAYSKQLPLPQPLQAFVFDAMKAMGVSPHGALVVETDTVNTVAIYDAIAHRAVPAVLSRAVPASSEELECGDLIDPGLYAVDMFVPALDLRQESRCGVSIKPWAAAWRAARAIYSLLGWVVTSLTILTITGILRRQAET